MSVGGAVLSISIIPQVYHGFKEKSGPIKFLTSVPTFIGLFITSFAMWTLSLFFSSIITLISGLMWFILFTQRIKYKR